jgi:hypothetical protein
MRFSAPTQCFENGDVAEPGLLRIPAKDVGPKKPRGFKSHRLRQNNADVMESVVLADSKSVAFGRVGSSPTIRTISMPGDSCVNPHAGSRQPLAYRELK